MAKRVLGVLAGETMNVGLVKAWARSADVLLAADGGADKLLGAGFKPDVTIGDLDSLSAPARRQLDSIEEDPDQNRSDCDKLLELCHRLGYSAITLIGAQGSRVDHMLATLHSAATSHLDVSIGYDEQWARVIRGPGGFVLDHFGLLSLLPLTECRGVTVLGVEWPFQAKTLDATSFTSLSNQALGNVQVSIEHGAAVLFMESDGTPRWEGERTSQG